jgi:hypothetical protein
VIVPYAGRCVGCRAPKLVKGGTSLHSWFVELHFLGRYVGVCR